MHRTRGPAVPTLPREPEPTRCTPMTIRPSGMPG